MKTTWTKGLDKDAAEEMKHLFKASAHLRSRLDDMIEAKAKLRIEDSLKKEGYETPNWAYKQADLTGYIRALKEIQNLLK